MIAFGLSLSARYDLSSVESTIVLVGCSKIVNTYLWISFPAEINLIISPRSISAMNKFIDIISVVINADYRENIRILIYNFGLE